MKSASGWAVHRSPRSVGSVAAHRSAVRVMAASNHQPAPASRQLLSVAPMMDWTDVYFRQLARLLSKRTWLWTEMVVDKTVLHSNRLDKHLWSPAEQSPIVCQLGGSDPELLAEATKKVVEYGYDEINLNCGCPSDRVAGAGCFGATLMLQPELVAACMKAIGEASAGIPISVKCRLGVDDVDSYEELCHFVKTVSEASPVDHFIVHTRKCFLQGLNPSQNRTVPPLRPEWAYALRRDFPHLKFSLNGGVQNCYEARSGIEYEGPWPTVDFKESRVEGGGGDCCGSAAAVEESEDVGLEVGEVHDGGFSEEECPVGVSGGMIEGVMIGRAAYNDPWGVLADADRSLFGEPTNPATSRRQVMYEYAEWADSQIGRWAVQDDGYKDPGVRLLMRPLLNLFHGEPGSKKWKTGVDIVLKQADADTVTEVLDRTLAMVPDTILDAPPRSRPMSGKGAPPSNLSRSYGELPTIEDKAGFNMSLAALKRKAIEANNGPKGAPLLPKAERLANKATAEERKEKDAQKEREEQQVLV